MNTIANPLNRNNPVLISLLIVVLVGTCFICGWWIGRGSAIETVKTAYMNLFEVMTNNRGIPGHYFVLYENFQALRHEVAGIETGGGATVTTTDAPNTARIEFTNAAESGDARANSAQFDLVANLPSVRFVLGSSLPFFCH